MSVDQAATFLADVPAAARSLQTLRDVGLGYLRLGQPATELSGGEAQRIKLATELQRARRGHTLYLLDEPTSGLHPADVALLLRQLHRLVDAGNTMVLVEHDLDAIATADWVIDLGPGGGDEGGRVVATGTPHHVARVEGSVTAPYLAQRLNRSGASRPARHSAQTPHQIDRPATRSNPPRPEPRTKSCTPSAHEDSGSTDGRPTTRPNWQPATEAPHVCDGTRSTRIGGVILARPGQQFACCLGQSLSETDERSAGHMRLSCGMTAKSWVRRQSRA